MAIATYKLPTDLARKSAVNDWTAVNNFDAVVRHKKSPLIDICHPDFGCLGNDLDAEATGNDVGLALAIAEASGGQLVAPLGTFVISAPIVLPTSGTTLDGVGNHTLGTVFKAKSSSGLAQMVRISGTFAKVNNLKLDGNNTALTGLMLHNAGRGGGREVFVTRTTEYGFCFDNNATASVGNNNSARLDKCIATSNLGIGFGVPDTQVNNNAISLIACTATLNGSHGALLRGQNWTVLSGHYEGNDGYGIKIGDVADSATAQGCALFQPWVEANDLGGILFGKASRCVYWKAGVGGAFQGVDWANSEGLNLEFDITSSGSNGVMRMAAGVDGQYLELRNNGITLGGGTDTDRYAQIVGKGRGGIRLGASSTVPLWTHGTGSPAGVVAAPIGSIYSRSDGTAATSFYVKESGTGTSGWVAK